MEVKIFKLLNGEELIARLEEVKDSGYVVSKPMIVQTFQTDKRGQMGVMLVPWVAGNQDIATVTIRKEIMSLAEPIDAAEPFEKQYLQQTSGIDLGGSGKIQV